MLLDDVRQGLTLVKMLDIVGWCWVMLELFGHPTQQNHVCTSAMESPSRFEFIFVGRGKLRVRFAKGENQK